MHISSPSWRMRAFSWTVMLAALMVWAGCNRTGTAPSNASQNNAQGAGGGQDAGAVAGNGGSAGPSGNGMMQGGPGPDGSYAQNAPPKPSPIAITVDRGTMVPVRIDHTLSTRSAAPGETFTGELYAPLLSADGAVAFPKGTPVTGSVVAAKNRGRFKGAGVLALRLDQVGRQAVSTDEYAITERG